MVSSIEGLAGFTKGNMQPLLLNSFAGRDNILGPRFQLKREGE